MPGETNTIVVIIGAVSAAIVALVTALVPVILAYINANLKVALAKIDDISKETKKQTKTLDNTEKIVAKIAEDKLVWSSEKMAFIKPQPVVKDDNEARL